MILFTLGFRRSILVPALRSALLPRRCVGLFLRCSQSRGTDARSDSSALLDGVGVRGLSAELGRARSAKNSEMQPVGVFKRGTAGSIPGGKGSALQSSFTAPTKNSPLQSHRTPAKLQAVQLPESEFTCVHGGELNHPVAPEGQLAH